MMFSQLKNDTGSADRVVRRRLFVSIALLVQSSYCTAWNPSITVNHEPAFKQEFDAIRLRRNFHLNKEIHGQESSIVLRSSSMASVEKIPQSIESRKFELTQLGAMLDRGQAYNPTSGEYYKDRMEVARQRIDTFVQLYPDKVPTKIQDIVGEWELVLTTVSNGIFRSSPFFLAIQEAFEKYSVEKVAFGMKKADLFFKLHELQTCSWGISKIGRVAQTITPEDLTCGNGSDVGSYLYSEFDTSLFSLTVIPILGWFKLLPTFGGCVVTAAKIVDLGKDGLLKMKVDYTTARKVEGLQGLGEWIWNVKVPVGFIWKNLLPWNRGRDPDCSVYIRYVDDNFRIVQDLSGDYFVYTRPVIKRPLDLAEPITRADKRT